MLDKQNDKIKLLNPSELDEHYGLPKFDKDEQPLFFELGDNEYLALQEFKHIKTKLFFILNLGYFRAKQQFFQFDLKDVQSDVSYIVDQYFQSATSEKILTGRLSRDTARSQRESILNLCEYSLWRADLHEAMALDYITQLLRRFPKGQDTFREFSVFLENKQITLPKYRTVQNLMTESLSIERRRLEKHLSTLESKNIDQLKALVQNTDGLSQLNIIRYDQPDFTYTSLKNELDKLGKIAALYPFSKTFVPVLGLSQNAVRYYATLVEQYPASRLRKLSEPLQKLYVLCFIYHRYQEFIDNLITSFMHYVVELKSEARQFAKDAETAYFYKVGVEMPQLVNFLNWYSGVNPKNISSVTAFHQKGFEILDANKQREFAAFLAGKSFDRKAKEWEFYEKKSRRIAMYLRPLLLAIPLEFHRPNALINRWMTQLRNYYKNGGAQNKLCNILPSELVNKLPKQIKPYLMSHNTPNPDFNSDKINPIRLEFYIYDKMMGHIDYGRLFCNDSVIFGSLDNDLVDKIMVNNVKEIAESTGYHKLASYCDSRLDDALNELDEAWNRTNQNIEDDKNTGINITTEKDGSQSWTLTYDSNSDNSDDFFNALNHRDIVPVIEDMGNRVNIWSQFKHKLARYTKKDTFEPPIFIAGLLAEAFGFGNDKMADMSDVNLNDLISVSSNYFYVENMMKGNAILSNYTDALPVSRSWDLYEGKRVADADGQKFITKFHTLQSRFSAKYYRTKRGISIYTLIANHIPINAKAIGPHEHESHHMFDIIYNNITNIPIDFITGDGHSTNQLNYVVTDLIDTQFIPNVKKIRNEADKIYCVNDPDVYKGLIKPKGKIDTALIKSEKQGILRILISLLLQENTQTVIIKKLSSHKRYSRLRKAFWEYNKIFKSTHILNVINDGKIRQVMKTARNRTESYHQLQRSIRKVHSGFFKGRRIVENQISCQATRLVANFIIAYNSTLLNDIYLRLVKQFGEIFAKKMMSSVSPVAWPHILLTGRYQFGTKDKQFDWNLAVETLENNLVETADN